MAFTDEETKLINADLYSPGLLLVTSLMMLSKEEFLLFLLVLFPILAEAGKEGCAGLRSSASTPSHITYFLDSCLLGPFQVPEMRGISGKRTTTKKTHRFAKTLSG